MSLRDAVVQAGSFDALLPHLKGANGPPRIMARAAGFFTSEGVPKKREDNIIPAWWWDQLQAVDPAANRAWFEMAIMADVSQDILATGLELESVAVEALFPARSKVMRLARTLSAPTPQNVGSKLPANPRGNTGGKSPEHEWKDGKDYIDNHVKEHGPLGWRSNGEPNKVAALRLLREYFGKPPHGPTDRTIYQWLQDNASEIEEWWGLKDPKCMF
jgi:hypothetical protein